MTMTTRAEIRSEIIDHLEQLKQMPHTEELISELADSNTPIYYGEIIDQWHVMPSEYDDRWKELHQAEDKTITDLMQTDLALYYYEQFLEVWEEVKSEHAISEA
tara:strand:+ start:950 stop:1261 length:312 start_codon:yes stop_codon:yes gene_type:complete